MVDIQLKKPSTLKRQEPEEAVTIRFMDNLAISFETYKIECLQEFLDLNLELNLDLIPL